MIRTAFKNATVLTGFLLVIAGIGRANAAEPTVTTYAT